jgi:putative Holliday junction resolvase
MSILALDVGSQRVGLAIASATVRLAHPMGTLQNDASFMEHLNKVVKDEAVGQIVVGLPRGLSGQTTAQTSLVEEFTQNLKTVFDLPIHMQDEAVTSIRAEDELRSRGKMYERGDIDALAATYILEDFLNQPRE